MITVICRICSKEFKALDERFKYCDETCRKQAKYNSLRAWEESHPEKAMARRKRWTEGNRDKVSGYNRTYREKKKKESENG